MVCGRVRASADLSFDLAFVAGAEGIGESLFAAAVFREEINLFFI